MTSDKNILIKNIYYMLSYAFRALKQSSFESVAVEEFDNAQNLFAAILSRGIGLVLKQGLYREYICVKNDLPLARGKIDMSGTIKHKMARRQVLTCEYDELSENNLFNQVLKATAQLLIKDENVKSEYKSALKKEMLYFSNVDKIEPICIAWNKIRFHRNNHTYRLLIAICRLVMDGMIQTTEEGKIRLNNFVDDQRMHKLYERFIFEYYRQEFPQLSVTASCIPWALDDGFDDALPQMQSDVMLSYKDKILIIDAKYYSHTMQMQFDKKNNALSQFISNLCLCKK